MAGKPEPLTTPAMDVRELDGFMFNVERVMASELFALSNGDEFKAAVALWCRAWKQVPAGSLPNDERILCAFSGAGAKWRKVREMAMRGFVECSDGRLYHRVLCEDVYRAWSAKQKFEDKKDGNSDRKRKEREERSQLFTNLKEHGVTPPWNATTRELRGLVTQSVTDLSQPVRVTGHVAVTPPVTVTVTALTCNGNGNGNGNEESSSLRSESCADAHSPPLAKPNSGNQEQEIPEFLDRRPKKIRHTLNGHGPDFAAFYDIYPLHKARRQAEKAYPAALKRAGSAEIILAGAVRYRDDGSRDPLKTKHPATWLNGDCWLDENATGPPKDGPVDQLVDAWRKEHEAEKSGNKL